MATKKTASKKTPTKKKSTVTSAKKAAPSKASASVGPLQLQKEREDFMTFRVNRETVYWVILGVVVILFTVWLMDLQADIQSLYDQIDLSNTSAN